MLVQSHSLATSFNALLRIKKCPTSFLKPLYVLSFQGNRQRQIIYRVTSQQDSSVLQVVSGPETSVQDEMSVDAMHVFINEHGESLEIFTHEVEAGSWQLSHVLCGLLA